MTLFTKKGVDIFAPTTAGGAPRSPSNGDAQIWSTEVEAAVNAALAGAGEIVGTWDASSGTFPGSGAADMPAAYLVTTAGTTGGVAFRVGDRIMSITTNSSTSTYAGNWLRLAGTLDPIVDATDSGAGSANAIQVVASKPVSSDGGQLVSFEVFDANTSGTVMLQITDSVGAVISGLSVKTVAGNNPAIGGLTSGLAVTGMVVGSEFRLITDLNAAALSAGMESNLALAVTARNFAARWSSDPEDGAPINDGTNTPGQSAYHHARKALVYAGALSADRIQFPTVTGLIADNNDLIGYSGSGAEIDVGADAYLWAAGFRYQVAASGATNQHVTTAGGVKLYVLPDAGGYNVKAFGAIGDNTADDTAAIQTAMDAGMANGTRVQFPAGDYRITDTISLLNANSVKSFGFYGQSGNSTRIYFHNAVSLKDLLYVDNDVNYLEVSDLEFIDNTARTSRGFYFFDTTASGSPTWKYLFRNVRIVQFKEGVRFDGGATPADDAHCSEAMFLHSKTRNCETGLIYNNTQAVNHQLIGFDMENDAEGVSDEWTHITMERGTTINHVGGSVIGKGPYLSYTYSVAGGFQDTSQFVSKGVRVEKRGGAAALISHDVSSDITLSNSLRIIVDDMPITASGGATLFARFGGRTFAKFSNVHANTQMDVEAYMTANLAANGLYGSIIIENCQGLNYQRISTTTAYGSAGVASTNYRRIPAQISSKNEGEQSTVDGYGFTQVSKPVQTIYSGGWEVGQIKTLVYVNADNAGFGSGSNPATALINLPLHGRPCKFRLLRDDVNAGSAFVLTLRAVIVGLFSISGCADNGAGLIRVTTSGGHGLVTGDGVTITGVVGTTEANASWSTITVISSTTFDLVGSTFVNAYVSGGTYTADKTVASITPTADVGGHFEANIQTATGLTYFLNNGAIWDGKMKVVKSGTVNGYIGLLMVDYM